MEAFVKPIGEDLVKRYFNRGLSEALVNRIAYMAYERGHSAGSDEVDMIFVDMMWNLFQISWQNDSPAKFD